MKTYKIVVGIIRFFVKKWGLSLNDKIKTDKQYVSYSKLGPCKKKRSDINIHVNTILSSLFKLSMFKNLFILNLR